VWSLFKSPGGAAVNSQGREPLDAAVAPNHYADDIYAVAPSGLEILRSAFAAFQGLTPLAINDRPSGARTGTTPESNYCSRGHF